MPFLNDWNLKRSLALDAPLLTVLLFSTTFLLLSSAEATAVDTGNVVALTMPFETRTRLVVIPVQINGSRPLNCILDTGMPEGLFIFDPALGEDLKLDYVTTVPVQGVGDATEMAQVAMGATLGVGDISIGQQNIIVLTKAGELAKIGVDGVIGAAVFNRYVVEIDFQSTTLNLYEQQGFDSRDAGQELALTITATKPFVECMVSVDGQTQIPATVVVDTGSTAALVLHTATLEGLELPSTTIETVMASGVGGDVQGSLGRVAGLMLGESRLNDIVSEFQERSLFGVGGSIGMGILSRFVVTFDYQNKRMLLRPNESFAEPFEFNMAGINLRPRAGKRLSVHSVLDESPAARKEIRGGDIIVALNGRDLAEYSDTDAVDLLQDVGKTVALTIEREGKRFEVSLTLERLI